MNFSKVLSSGYTTLFCALAAIVFGLIFPDMAKEFKPFSQIFLTMISLTVIPIIFASVTCSIIKIMTSDDKDIKISNIVFTFLVALIISGIIGVLMGMFVNSKDVTNSEIVSKMIFQDMQKSIAELSIDEPFSNLKKFNFSDFFMTLLPKNPFEAFAKGNVIQIITLSILVGVAVAALNKFKREITLTSLGVLMSSFKAILKIPTKILPIGTFFLLSSSLSEIDLNVLFSMKSFCLYSGLGFLLINLIALGVFYLYSPIGLKKSVIALKESIIVAFSTCSNQATVPFLISSLSNKFNLPNNAVDLSIPLGVTMCRASNVAYYALVTIFIASIYNEPLGIMQYGFVVLGAILTSFAASGTSGVIAITMITIILDPLNLPIGSILILLVVIDSIINPFRTVTSLIVNAALSCFIINKKRCHNEA